MKKGFTLIELMIVVAIIGILAAVAVPKFADMLRKSKEGATKGGLTNLRSSLTIYISDNDGLTPDMGTNGALANTTPIVPKYVEAIPSVKLGSYHNDSNQIVVRATAVFNRGALALLYNSNGWMYSSWSGATIFVNCIHTDTKNTWVTNW